MTNLQEMTAMLTGWFDNRLQLERLEKEGIAGYPYARHVNTVCNEKITGLPDGFKGVFLLEESYYTVGERTNAMPHLFLMTQEGEDVVLNSYELPEGYTKAEFTWENLGELSYDSLKRSRSFTPAVYRKKDGCWEGGSESMLAPALRFTLWERFSWEVLEVAETMEREGKRVFGYDLPLEYRRLGRVVFLDRDGTVNEEVNYLHRPEDLRFLPGAAEAIRRFGELGFSVVVVSNQAGIARGYYTERDFLALSEYMNRVLSESGAHIDGFYFCPHHPEHGIGEYRKPCHCRKPDTGMFEQAAERFLVDKAHSYMIGDKLIDTQAGHNFGLRSVLVGTGYGEKEREKAAPGDYDWYAGTLLEAADWIQKEEQGWNL